MWSLSRLIWLTGTAVTAYIAGAMLVTAVLLQSSGPTPVKDFLILGGLYVGLVAPATYAAFAFLERRASSAFSSFVYILCGAVCGAVPAVLFWWISGREGPLFVMMFALHCIPAGAILGLGFSLRNR